MDYLTAEVVFSDENHPGGFLFDMYGMSDTFHNGCFWHAHQGCKWFVPPKSNSEFWQHKFMYNIERDERNYQKLCDLGWRVIIVWECEIRHGDASLRLAHLVSEIKEV